MSNSVTGNILRGLGAIAFLGLAGAGIYFFGVPALSQHGTEVAARGPGAGGGGGGPPPASVFAEPVRTQTFANRVEAIGTLEANERADLTLSASDRVTAVYFEDGERVKAGKTLVSLAQREQSALVEGAEAELAQANQELARLEPLTAQGAVSQAELDVARRNANAAAAQLRAVQSRQRDRVLVAPFDGVLGFRQVSVGSLVRPGDVVATLIDDSVMRLDFAVPSIFLTSLQPGLEIEARSADIPGRTFKGIVDSINNADRPGHPVGPRARHDPQRGRPAESRHVCRRHPAGRAARSASPCRKAR